MPGGISGIELAAKVGAERPEMRLLLMSGHSIEPQIKKLEFSHDVELLHKPFRSDDFAKKVRSALDAPPPTP